MSTLAKHVTTAMALILGTLVSPVGAQQEGAIVETGRSTLPRHMARLNRARPVIAVVGHNAATELTDYVVPFGILMESGVAEVIALSTRKTTGKTIRRCSTG